MTHNPLAISPHNVKHPVMYQRWEQLTFLHWRFAITDIQRLLPEGLHVQTFEGKAWVGLVPFHISVALPHVPEVPWLSRFPETNVRTYVHDDQGRVGIWFFSLEATRLSAVLTARFTYRLPYMWAKMSLVESANSISYSSKRLWPRPKGAKCIVDVNIGNAYEPHELTPLEHFLTARWRLFSTHVTGLVYANATHEPWPLYRASATVSDSSVIEAAGLPAPQGEPLVHYSPGVKVRIGLPHQKHN